MLRKFAAIRSFDVPGGKIHALSDPQAMTSSRTKRNTIETNNRVAAVWTSRLIRSNDRSGRERDGKVDRY